MCASPWTTLKMDWKGLTDPQEGCMDLLRLMAHHWVFWKCGILILASKSSSQVQMVLKSSTEACTDADWPSALFIRYNIAFVVVPSTLVSTSVEG